MYRYLAVCGVMIVSLASFSQKRFVSTGNYYLSWGYNTEWYSTSNIHAALPDLNSDFTYQNIQGHDHIGWDKLFQRAITIPQYNYRIGYFFNEKQDLGIELNFDHTKYVVTQGQSVKVSGKMNGRSIDTTVVVAYNTLDYQLNNGANFFLFNIVKKLNIYETPKGGINICGLGKFGVGPLIPHVQNRIFGNDNIPHFQFGGWNTGIEAGLKVTIAKHIYLEFCNKLDYARYSQLDVYKGKVNQSFFCYELILNLGYTFKACRANKEVSGIPKN
jgi:hypothetical protein